MNPTEARNVQERIEALERDLRWYQDAVRNDAECKRLRDMLERAEITARKIARPFLGEINAELGRLRPELDAWKRDVENAQKQAESKLDMNRRVTMRLVDRIERPRVENGVDYSNTRIVLARYGPLELWWNRSGKNWADMMQGYISHGGTLYVANVAGRADRSYKEISDGGRLSRARIMAFSGRINAHFGIPDVAENIDWKRTLLVEDMTGEVEE